MNTNESNDPEAMLEEAATVWLLEREEGFTPDRAEAFAEWRRRDPRHAAAIARVERTLSILGEMPAIREPLGARVSGAAGESAPQPKTGRPRSRPWAWAVGLAATVVFGASMWWLGQLSAVPPQIYEASGSEPQRVSLADGSVVDLNSYSRVEVNFSPGERHLTLVSGEAHFQVAHNKARPFIVVAHGVAVRAVGTAFNVRLAGDKVDVLVAEGKVAIAREDTSTFFRAEQPPVVPLLVAGERTQVTPSSHTAPRVEEVAATEVHALLAWQNRMTSFADVPLSEMIARINRCNTVQLELGDPQLGDRKVGGVIDLTKLNAFVHLLEQDGDIVAEHGTAGKIVLRRAP